MGSRLGVMLSRLSLSLFCPMLLVFSGVSLGAQSIERGRVDFDFVAALAQNLSQRAHRAPRETLPPTLRELDYDQFRQIRFNASAALWRGDGVPFQIQFFHRGFLFPDRVSVSEFSPTHFQEIPFLRDFFDYGELSIDRALRSDLGFAGFRVHTPINTPDVFDEFLVFLGSSYFRAVARDQVYGLSARGLSLDTAEAAGEEFPRFTRFWLGKPTSNADRLQIYALLESPSVVGAYAFEAVPGDETLIEVRARLYFREHSRRVGFAPLTSMFLFGPHSQNRFDDWRPAVHDSDGLLLMGEDRPPLFRPLVNDGTYRFSVFEVSALKGFGLLQRERAFHRFEDLEARYDLRPSVWVEPVGDWGNGAVWLYEFPVVEEVIDNVNAFWVPSTLPPPGEPFEIAYRLHWLSGDARLHDLRRVVATRKGVDLNDRSLTKFIVEFEAAEDVSPRDLRSFSPVLTVEGAEVVNRPVLQLNHVEGRWRVFFDLRPEADRRPVEISVSLERGLEPYSETWSYQWKPLN
jgi:glucans biosynthesis protein